MNVPGGANLVALQAVKDLKIGNMTVSSMEYNFLDVDQIVRKLGAENSEGAVEASPTLAIDGR